MQFVRLVANARKWRYSDFESKGRRFESCWVHHIYSKTAGVKCLRFRLSLTLTSWSANSHGRVSYLHFIEEVELLAVFKRGHGKAP
jgi:hypothetical protein